MALKKFGTTTGLVGISSYGSNKLQFQFQYNCPILFIAFCISDNGLL